MTGSRYGYSHHFLTTHSTTLTSMSSAIDTPTGNTGVLLHAGARAFVGCCVCRALYRIEEIKYLVLTIGQNAG